MSTGSVAVVVLMLILAARLIALPIAVAQEESGEPFKKTVGPYEIEIAASASTLSLGKAIFAITVLDAADGQPVPDARVVLRTKHVLDGAEGWGLAVQTTNTPGRFDAQMNLDTPGVWNVNVEVSSSLGEVSVEGPPVTIPKARGLSQGSFVFLGVFLILASGVLWVWWSARRQLRRRAQDKSDPAPTSK